jgi:uncharacterized protein (TIGR00251 family)
MILNIRVLPKSSKAFIKKEEGFLKAYLTKPARGGLANKQLIELLAEYLGIKKYQIMISKGEKSRDKIIQINE